MKPTKPYDDRAADASRDFAGADGFSLFALERMLQDCAEQPNWRMRAKVCAAYYDGKQLTELQRWHIREEDLEERATNLIRPVINSVLGQEAKSRTDVKIESDDDTYADVSEVVSAKLKEAERETLAHMAVSEAYASMVKKGLGWVHVCRNSDPLDYPYKVESVPIDEIWWDWRGQRGTTFKNGGKWLVRMRMIDLDEVEASMPKFKNILRMSADSWQTWGETQPQVGEPERLMLQDAYDRETRFNLMVNKWDWFDTARKMIKMYEVWYRVPAEVVVLHFSPTRKVPYNAKDPRHVEAVARGLVKLSRGVTSQVRRALYAGPYRLLDEATTLRNFPYFPMFAFRDDEDGSPYGLIDGMISPQDEFNERRLRIQWMLKARQVQMDSDAVDPRYNSIEEIADAIMRPDLVVITNPQRTNKGQGVIVKNELSMQKEQFEVMADSKGLIQDTAGRYSSQMGNAQVQSGIANSILVEQGEQSMGEMNDNYVFGRRSAFEHLTELIIEDHKQANMKVAVGSGKTRRWVVLNSFDRTTGMPINQVEDANIKTALAETPNTPAYRQQTQQQVATIIQALGNNPQATAILAPAYIESTSLPNRQQVADDLRKATGQPVPGDKEGQAQAEAQAQQAQATQAAVVEASAKAKIDVDVSAAERNRAQARKATADAVLVEERIAAGEPAAEVAKTLADTAAVQDQAANEDQIISDALDEAQAA